MPGCSRFLPRLQRWLAEFVSYARATLAGLAMIRFMTEGRALANSALRQMGLKGAMIWWLPAAGATLQLGCLRPFWAAPRAEDADLAACDHRHGVESQ